MRAAARWALIAVIAAPIGAAIGWGAGLLVGNAAWHLGRALG